MMALGVAVGWFGYAVTIYGYCLVKGYDVPFAQLFKAKWNGPAVNNPGPLPPADPGTGTFNV